MSAVTFFVLGVLLVDAFIFSVCFGVIFRHVLRSLLPHSGQQVAHQYADWFDVSSRAWRILVSSGSALGQLARVATVGRAALLIVLLSTMTLVALAIVHEIWPA
jgi:cell division protein FtsL